MERSTSGIVGWEVTFERDQPTRQALLDRTPAAVWYFSDWFATYKSLRYTLDLHTPMPDKSETYRVEGMNTELRHSLKRLVRKTRNFSRCVQALCGSIKIFVFAWNRRRYP
ncbi:MAG: IS1 family transposase, partial [Anaerolineae bacterium]|nr:IS1 family transposase [Anaerolineae bacterium]